MSKSKEKNPKTKTVTVSFKMTQSELTSLKSNAEKNGNHSVSDYLRALIENATPPAGIEERMAGMEDFIKSVVKDTTIKIINQHQQMVTQMAERTIQNRQAGQDRNRPQ